VAESTTANRAGGKPVAAKTGPAPAKAADKKPVTDRKTAEKAALITKAVAKAAVAKAALLKGKAGATKDGAKKGGAIKDGVKAGGKLGSKDAKDGKKLAVPPAPPRKIQVVQRSTLKPGARGTKATVKRQPAVPQDGVTPGAMKKRRSAELTKQQLDHFGELLMQRRSRLSHDLSLMQDEALKVTTQDNSSDSVADTGTDNYEQDFTLGLIESEEALAREVDQALLRINQNAFGVCEACQTPIPLARLEILPFARFCVDCQQKREGRA
jgi:DnaK suppressor protein